MPHSVRAVVARAKGEPVTLEIIEVPDPGPGEVLVTVQACGVTRRPGSSRRSVTA